MRAHLRKFACADRSNPAVYMNFSYFCGLNGITEFLEKKNGTEVSKAQVRLENKAGTRLLST